MLDPRLSTSINFNGFIIKPKDHVKLLGVIIDNKLSFKPHIENMCKKVSQKSKAIFRIRPYINLNGAKMLYNAFIKSIFNYCPLVWTSGCDILSNALINRTHCRSLRAVYQNHSLSYAELLSLYNCSSIHVDNIRHMLTEVYKAIHKINPSFMWDIFLQKNDNYNLRVGQRLKLPPTNTKTYGTNGFAFRASILWNCLPHEIKNSKSISEFKHKILTLPNVCCSCKLCS